MASLKHELWVENDEEETFCLAGPRGNDARSILSKSAKLLWTVWANSHFEAMSKYYEYRGWGTYSTEHETDFAAYPEEWAHEQAAPVSSN